MEEQIDLATQELSAAQEFLDESKKAATEEELREQSMDLEDDVEVMERPTGPALRDGLSGMLESLEQLRDKTEAITQKVQQEEKSKRWVWSAQILCYEAF